jgi:hypothetical protein
MRGRSLQILRKFLPAALSLMLLIWQASLPWTLKHFVTQDGPSHLYNGVVARTLLFHRQSHYGAIYEVNPRPVPNWGSAIVLGSIEYLLGPAYAEKAAVSMFVLLGYFSLAYAFRSLRPKALPYLPLINFLLQSWFLYYGVYNFYFAMVAFPFLVGYYLRHGADLRTRHAAVIGTGLIALFFLHLIGAILALVAIAIVFLWRTAMGAPSLPDRRSIVLIALAIAPTLALLIGFAVSSAAPSHQTDALHAIASFPLHVFTTAAGRAGNQIILWPAVLCLLVATLLVMTRSECRGDQGAITLATVLVFAIYVFVPDAGFGGSDTKVRFAWGVFLFASMAASTTRRFQFLSWPFAMLITALLAANLVVTRQELAQYSRVADEYLAVTDAIPRGASIVRLRYSDPRLPVRFGYEDIGRDPTFHLDAFAAARCRCIDLSDYQAASQVFPVRFNKAIDIAQQSALWGFEGPADNAVETLSWLRQSLPMPIDYVIVAGDFSSADRGRQTLLSTLDAELILMPQRSDFVRVYRRTKER